MSCQLILNVPVVRGSLTPFATFIRTAVQVRVGKRVKRMSKKYFAAILISFCVLNI